MFGGISPGYLQQGKECWKDVQEKKDEKKENISRVNLQEG